MHPTAPRRRLRPGLSLALVLLGALAGVSGFALAEDATAAKVGTPFEVAGLTFTPPADWKAVKPSSTMRKAQFALPGREDGQAAELVFFHFGGGQGGSVEANVQRWLGQFKEPKEQLSAKTRTLEAGGGKITIVEAKGTYLSGPPFGAKKEMPGYMLAGGIVEGSDGPIFIKLTGPVATVQARLEQFEALLRSPFAPEKKGS